MKDGVATNGESKSLVTVVRPGMLSIPVDATASGAMSPVEMNVTAFSQQDSFLSSSSLSHEAAATSVAAGSIVPVPDNIPLGIGASPTLVSSKGSTNDKIAEPAASLTTPTVNKVQRGLPPSSHTTVLTQTQQLLSGNKAELSKKSSMTTQIHLEDVFRANPLESETETNILSSVEEHDARMQQNLSGSNPETSSSLFGNSIPDRAAELFIEYCSDLCSNGVEAEYLVRPQPVSRAQSVNLLDRSTPARSRTVSTNTAPAGFESHLRQPQDRTILERSQVTRPDPISPGANEIKNTSKVKAAIAPQATHHVGHKRHLTIEQELQGLTATLMGLHSNNNENSNHMGSTNAVYNAPMAPSSADTLAQNAKLLFQRSSQSVVKSPLQPTPQNPCRSGHAITDFPIPQQARYSTNLHTSVNADTSPRNWDVVRSAVLLETNKDVAAAKKKNDDNDMDRDQGTSSHMGASIMTDHSTQQERLWQQQQQGLETLVLGDKENSSLVDEELGNVIGQQQQDMNQDVNGYTRLKTPRAIALASKLSFIKDFRAFFASRFRSIVDYCVMMLYIIVPTTIIAFILYYLADNPPTGKLDRESSAATGTLINDRGRIISADMASASYWLLFLGVRQVVTFSLAQATQVFWIDFFCLGMRWSLRLFGPMVTLLIVQSKGWPFLATWWAIYNFILLRGSGRFSLHWLYFQNFLGIFNDMNPSGSIITSEWNGRALAVCLSFGIIVSVKRLWIGLFLGRKTFVSYAKELKNVMQRVVLISQIAALARDWEWESRLFGRADRRLSIVGRSRENLAGLVLEASDENGSLKSLSGKIGPHPSTHADLGDGGLIIDPDEKDPLTGGLSQAQRMKVIELLGSWEEPDKLSYDLEENVSVSSILQFRQSVSMMENRHLFSVAFGLADSRENTIQSAQNVYRRLCTESAGGNGLNFDMIAHLALHHDGTLDQNKIRKLIKLLRPDRDGNLSLLDFVTSVDTVYKEVRLLRASVKNSQKLDRALERIINIAFYTIMVCFTLSQLGYNPLALFLSLSSIVLGFAFMIGSASAKYFDGLLFILVRKPYDIGDRISISDVNNETNTNGSSTWYVMDINLFTTTVLFATTGERATLSNGSLASSRIINAARSPKALLYVYLKFGTEVPFEKIKMFEQGVRTFVRDRPREWLNLSSFRATRFEADLGFIEYVVCLQHRESWQNLRTLLASKAEVAAYCLELTKKMNMRYTSPPLPVDLSFVSRKSPQIITLFDGLSADPDDGQFVASMFERSDGV